MRVAPVAGGEGEGAGVGRWSSREGMALGPRPAPEDCEEERCEGEEGGEDARHDVVLVKFRSDRFSQSEVVELNVMFTVKVVEVVAA
jgi:hypothetical protein